MDELSYSGRVDLALGHARRALNMIRWTDTLLRKCRRDDLNPMRDIRVTAAQRLQNLAEAYCFGIPDLAQHRYQTPAQANAAINAVRMLTAGFSLGWFGIYEGAIVDVSDALGVATRKEDGSHRSLMGISRSLLKKMGMEKRVRRMFMAHLGVSQATRNTVHSHFIHDPRGETLRLPYMGRVYRFRPGYRIEASPPTTSTTALYGRAFSNVVRLMTSPAVAGVASEIMDSHCEDKPP